MRVRRSCECSMLVRCTFPYFLLGTPPGYDRENPRNPWKITQYMILMEKKNKVYLHTPKNIEIHIPPPNYQKLSTESLEWIQYDGVDWRREHLIGRGKGIIIIRNFSLRSGKQGEIRVNNNTASEHTLWQTFPWCK